MPDQANKLRELAFTATATSSEAGARVPMVVVTGAKAGVGATTVAVNLAAALADRGERLVAVDAAQHGNNLVDVADVGRSVEYSLSDVIDANCSVRDAMVMSPGAMHVLSSKNSRGSMTRRFASSPRRIFDRRDAATSDSRAGQQRLLSELDSLGDEADVVVVDTGYGLTAWSRRFWMQARLVVLVTTTDDASILAAYTALKLSAADGIRPTLRVLVNGVEHEREAADALRRIDNSCRRFLSLPVEALPALVRHEDESGASRRRPPRVWETPHSAFGRGVLWVARDVGELLGERMQEAGCRGHGLDQATDIQYPASSIL